MEISIQGLLRLALASVVCGVALGALYDMLRFSRMGIVYSVTPAFSLRQGRYGLHFPRYGDVTLSAGSSPWQKTRMACRIFLDDVFFFVAATLLLLVVIYYANSGQFRIMSVCGAVLGYKGYGITVGKVCAKWAIPVLKVVKLIRHYLCLLILYPFIYVGIRLMDRIRHAATALRITRRERKLDRYTKQERARICAELSHNITHS